MSQDEKPGKERDQDELIAAFAALGGSLVRLAALLLTGHRRSR